MFSDEDCAEGLEYLHDGEEDHGECEEHGDEEHEEEDHSDEEEDLLNNFRKITHMGIVRTMKRVLTNEEGLYRPSFSFFVCSVPIYELFL